MKTHEYFSDFEKNIRKVYVAAEEARLKGLDPSKKVEIPLARSLAEKVVSLIAAPKRIRKIFALQPLLQS